MTTQTTGIEQAVEHQEEELRASALAVIGLLAGMPALGVYLLLAEVRIPTLLPVGAAPVLVAVGVFMALCALLGGAWGWVAEVPAVLGRGASAAGRAVVRLMRRAVRRG